MTDDTVKKLGEIIFTKKDKKAADVAGPDLSIPACLLENDFLQKMQKIMCMKQMIYNSEWKAIIIQYCQNMLSSPDMYLRGIIFACLAESIRNESIFEGFVSMCALLKFVTDDMFLGVGLDFCDLNRDIFKALYGNFFRAPFRKRGGFRKLVKYIQGHRYLTWKWNLEDIVLSKDSTLPLNPAIQDDIMEKVKEEYSRRDSHLDVVTVNNTSTILAQRLLPTISVDFPSLPSDPALIMKLLASRFKKPERKEERTRMVELAESFIDFDLQEHSSSDSMTNRSRNGDNARYENIIQTVITYNRSKSSGSKTSDNHIQKESD